MRRAFAERSQAMHRRMAAVPGVRCRAPQGAFYLLPDVSAYLGSTWRGQRVESVTTLAALLLEHARAAVVPGDVFEAPYAIRLSYACSTDDVVRGMDRVADFFRQLQL